MRHEGECDAPSLAAIPPTAVPEEPEQDEPLIMLEE